MKTLGDITEILRLHKRALQKKYPLHSLGIFGSYARGEQKKDSDIDILVEVEPTIGLEFVSLADELEKLLQHKVDLVSKRGIKPHHLPLIESELVYV